MDYRFNPSEGFRRRGRRYGEFENREFDSEEFDSIEEWFDAIKEYFEEAILFPDQDNEGEGEDD